MNVLVTGSNGFIGQALCKRMLADGYQVRGAVRSAAQMTALPSGVEGAMVGNISSETDWSDALSGIEGIVHLAARVHVMRESAADPLAAFREVNVEGTKGLAIAAANAGVKRFVYISSVKVNGEGMGAGGRRLGDGGQWSEVRGQEKIEDRSQKSEVRGQEKTGNKEQGAGNRRQGIGGRDQRSEDRSHPGEMRSAVVNEFHWAGRSEGTPVEFPWGSPIQLGKEVSLRHIGAYAPVGGQEKIEDRSQRTEVGIRKSRDERFGNE